MQAEVIYSPMFAHAFHKHFADAFDTGIRTFDQPYLLYASAGAFHLETQARTWLLLPHRAALIQQAYPIRIWTTGPATSSSVLFDDTQDCPLNEPCQVIPVTPLLLQMIAHTHRWNSAEAAKDPTSAVFFQALRYVAMDAACSPDRMWFPNAQSPEIRRAIDWTMQRLGERLRFTDAATAAHVSERTLARRFASELGLSWHQFLKRVRLMEAARLLTLTNKSAAEIAYETGLASASAFSSQFSELMGETPTRYRQRLHESAGSSM